MTPQTNSLYTEIETLLKSIPEFLTEEKELRYNKIKEMTENGDVKLIEPLLKDEKMKNAFFAPILDSFVFKTKEFKEFLDYSSSNNSYSQYLGKKIGLYMGDSALTDRSEVVLNFPYKDCVLEGGQTKEDGLDTYFAYDEKTGDYVEKTDKRREVFFNETLAKDEIDSLFSPKAFCNVKKFTKDGEEICTKFERNAKLNKNRGLSEDTITDNLIIKGNNLLALHSLKKEFEGKVKCTFLDPPYYFIDNKSSDTFSYNSNFKLSSWLTFMKDRIQITRNLLSEDGLLFITISDEGAHYLKVLIDDIFGTKNFIADITWESRKSVSSDGLISLNSNHVLVFAKNISIIKKNDFRLALDLESFSYDDNDGRGKYRLEPFDAPGIRKNLSYEIENPNTHEKFIPPVGRCWRTEKENYEKYLKENRIRFGVNGTAKPQYKAYYSEVVEAGKGKAVSSIFHDVQQSILWENLDSNTNATKDLQKLFESIDFTNPKPEDLISRIIELSTEKNDIVLEFFLGSGTTAAVAHKMNRQYIGVEQMDYIKTISCERLKKVINGDTTGISKSVNWQGGGSFVYLELAEKNEKAMRLISACKSYDELVSIFENLSQKYFLHYNVKVNEFINKTCKEEEFKKLSLERQKEIFARMLDLNQLYVNCDDRNDKDSGLAENDIKATEDFYQISKDGE